MPEMYRSLVYRFRGWGWARRLAPQCLSARRRLLVLVPLLIQDQMMNCGLVPKSSPPSIFFLKIFFGPDLVMLVVAVSLSNLINDEVEELVSIKLWGKWVKTKQSVRKSLNDHQHPNNKEYAYSEQMQDLNDSRLSNSKGDPCIQLAFPSPVLNQPGHTKGKQQKGRWEYKMHELRSRGKMKSLWRTLEKKMGHSRSIVQYGTPMLSVRTLQHSESALDSHSDTDAVDESDPRWGSRKMGVTVTCKTRGAHDDQILMEEDEERRGWGPASTHKAILKGPEVEIFICLILIFL